MPRKRTAYKTHCEMCDKEFYTIPSQKARFCSVTCRSVWQGRNRVQYFCNQCGKDFTSYKTAGRKYCSNQCKVQALATLKKERYKNRIKTSNAGAREIKQCLLDTNPKCQKCGWDEIPQVLEAHHLDRNRQNNVLENIVILCPNCHSVEHYQAKDGQFYNNIGRIQDKTEMPTSTTFGNENLMAVDNSESIN